MAAFFGAKQTIRLEVQGMTCQSCVARVQAALQSVPGVAKAAVDLEKGRAEVVTKAGANQDAMLVMAVKQVGYDATVTAQE